MKVSEAKATNQFQGLKSKDILFISNARVLPQENMSEAYGRVLPKREFSVTNPARAKSNRPKYRVLGQPGNFNSLVW